MKVAVLGLGSIGKRHIMNMISLGIAPADITGVETRKDRQEETQKRFGVTQFVDDYRKLKGQKFDCAFICTPTSLHIEPAKMFAEQGAYIFMEKPLSHNMDGVEELVKIVKAKNVEVLMAYIFRFAPSVRKLKELIDANAIGKVLYFRGEFSEYLPDWHPWEDYRSFYMAKKSMGGGSILDQSHIIDLAHYLFGEVNEVFAFNGKVSDLEVDADDMAEITASFKSGLQGTIHSDMLGRAHKKWMEIKGTKGNIEWDFYDYSVKLYHADDKKWETWTFKKDANEMYINEMQHFLDCVKNRKRPLIPLEEGVHTMKIILASEKSSKTRKLELVDA